MLLFAASATMEALSIPHTRTLTFHVHGSGSGSNCGLHEADLEALPRANRVPAPVGNGTVYGTGTS